MRLLQVGRVKALGEPAIHLRQQVAGIVALALLLPEPPQAPWRPAAPRIWPAGGALRSGPAGSRLPRGQRRAWRSRNAPWSPIGLREQVAAARWPRSPSRASASRRSPSSTWPACPAASASVTRQNGRASSFPVAKTASRPWCICASAATPWPCMVSAQPRQKVPSAVYKGNPCASPGPARPRPAPRPPAPPGGGDAERPPTAGRTPDYGDGSAPAPGSAPPEPDARACAG